MSIASYGGAVRVCAAPFLLAMVLQASPVASAQSTESAPKGSVKAQLNRRYGNLPLSFEENRGQADKSIHFVSRGGGYGVYLTDSGAVLSLKRQDGGEMNQGMRLPVSKRSTGDAFRMTLAGQSLRSVAAGLEQLPGSANYLIGNDPAKWHTSIPTYAKVRYGAVYPGIDLVYYGNQRQLEYDFVVAPHADPGQIQIRFNGARRLQLTANGDLEVIGHDGQIAFHKPTAYQDVQSERQAVEGKFTVLSGNLVAFSIGKFDHAKPLVIDPVLSYSTYLGGSGGDFGAGIAIDTAGDAYITGTTYSQNFPVSAGAYGPSTQGTGAPEAFVTKMNATGTALVYSTYIGGSGDEYGGDGAAAIKVNSKGYAFITGSTYSEDFPVVGSFVQSINNCINGACTNGFITEVNATGTNLINSTYLGGGAQGGIGDMFYGLALDNSGNVYLTGSTASVDFPVTAHAYQGSNKAASTGGTNAFVAKLNAAFNAIVYSTFLGGTTGDSGSGIAIDSTGDAYVTGSTYSTNFPVTSSAYQKTNKAAAAKTGTTAFVTKLNTTGSSLVYSTYLGGSGSSKVSGGDAGNGIAVDSSGEVSLTGSTTSSNFPVTTGAYQTTNKDVANLGPACFVTRFNAAGSALVYSTYLGGSGVSGYTTGDSCLAIALDSSDHAYVVGSTASKDFPVTSGAVQSTNRDPNYGNAFLTELNSAGSSLVFSTFLGGTDAASADIPGDSATALALDGQGNVYISGRTGSSNFPLTKSAYQSINHGSATGFDTVFVSKINLASTTPVVTTTKLTASTNPESAGLPITFTAVVAPTSGNEYPTGTVDFLVDGKQTSAVALASGQAAYTTSALTQGTHTLKASFVADTDFAASSASLTETITEAVTDTPVFSPAVGIYTTAQSVILTDATSGASIYYTTNGATPTTSSTKYTAAISVKATETIKALAVAASHVNSIVVSGTYTIEPATATPKFSPVAGSYNTAQSVSITDATSGAAIYYTNDGTTPSANSSRYSSPITVNYSQTLKAIAILTGHDNSPIASAAYTITVGPTTTPTFTPAAGTYTGAQTITIKETDAYADVYYTTDGSTPTESSNPYFEGILEGGSGTIKAIAVGGTITNPIISAVGTAKYTIKASSAYLISTIAGNGKSGSSGNGGAATSAELKGPNDVAIDASGNLYISDTGNNVVRKVSTSGTISAFAGTGKAGYSGDGGAATSAELNGPSGLAVDSKGNLYIADANNERIRKVTTAGIISTYAGNGKTGYTGNGGAATSATMNGPAGIAFDSSGNLYISDNNNSVVRKVTAATTAVPTPVITTFAGNGISGYSGDGGAATKSELTNPLAVAVDSKNNVYIADSGNSVVRKVTTAGTISTFAGNGFLDFTGQGVPATTAALYGPQGVAADAAGNVYIADTQNNCIRMVNTSGIITIFAGTGVAGFSGDGGPAQTAQMSTPNLMKVDSKGNFYFADYSNNRIRKIALPASASVEGDASSPSVQTPDR